MKTVLCSPIPFYLEPEFQPTRRVEFDAPGGIVRVQHLPCGGKTFSGYLLDLGDPSPDLCRVTRAPGLTTVELLPVPLGLPEECVAEETFPVPKGTGSVRVLRRAGCCRVELDAPDFRETFTPSPLAKAVEARAVDLGGPAVLVTADERVVLFAAADFAKLLDCTARDVAVADKKLTLTRLFADSRQRYCRQECVLSEGALVLTRLSEGFSSRKKTFSELTPLYFVESLLEGFDEEARGYLSADLAQADPAAMRAFFGEAERILWLSGKVGLVRATGATALYTFELEGGKIVNFSD